VRNFWKLTFTQRPKLSWSGTLDFLFIFSGAFLQALALVLFLVPAQLASGGVSGIAQIVNKYTGWPLGLMIFLGNLPLFIIGWRFLGGPRFAMRTAFAVAVVAILTDALTWLLPPAGLTEDIFLNMLYGGVVSGLGFGLVYRGQGTSGGSDILARILTNWRGIPISQSYMLTDTLVMLLAGLTFSWNNALYAIVNLYISGIAAEAILEGSNVVRTVMMITDNPEPIIRQVLESMQRGVTILSAQGAYTRAERTVLYCVITRAEVAQLKSLVRQIDPTAFIVVGLAQEVLGEGFKPLNS
jgi:uncharacterized membrane-anchored protein YitT (DUF2179 family)